MPPDPAMGGMPPDPAMGGAPPGGGQMLAVSLEDLMMMFDQIVQERGGAGGGEPGMEGPNEGEEPTTTNKQIGARIDDVGAHLGGATDHDSIVGDDFSFQLLGSQVGFFVHIESRFTHRGNGFRIERIRCQHTKSHVIPPKCRKPR